MVAWLLLPLLGLVAGLGKAAADAHAHGSARLARWFPRWAGPESWRNKYRNQDPTQGPRFWLSTTLLVWVTDLWHTSNAVQWLAADAVVLGLAYGTPRWWPAVVYVVVRRAVFEPVYKRLRK